MKKTVGRGSGPSIGQMRDEREVAGMMQPPFLRKITEQDAHDMFG